MISGRMLPDSFLWALGLPPRRLPSWAVTFSESSLWISSEACDACADSGHGTPLWFHVGQGSGSYTPAQKQLRGTFRYLTMVSNPTSTVPLLSLRVYFTAAPMQQLRNYMGWFDSNFDLINRPWYLGTYTNQLCTIDLHHGDALVHLGTINPRKTSRHHKQNGGITTLSRMEAAPSPMERNGGSCCKTLK